MAQKNKQPLIFSFGDDEIEPKEPDPNAATWDQYDMVLKKEAAAAAKVAAPPVPAPASALVPVSLLGWAPHIVAEVEAAGIYEVPARTSDRARSRTAAAHGPALGGGN